MTRNRLPVVVAKIIICDVEEYEGHVMGRITACTSMVEAFHAMQFLVGDERVRGFDVVKIGQRNQVIHAAPYPWRSIGEVVGTVIEGVRKDLK